MAAEEEELTSFEPEAQGGVLNFFMHGTSYHEGGNVQSLVSKFAEVTDNAIIANGPGSATAEAEEITSTPGLYALSRDNQRVALTTPIPSAVVKLVGLVAGYGVEHNLVEMFLRVWRTLPRPKTINLMGFSRGADACLRFANILYRHFPEININIFAVEPVAGPGRGENDYARRIPPNVKNYVATLAMHENRAIMSPQDYTRVYVEDSQETKVKFLPLPGEHGTHARLIAENPHTWDASKLVTDMAYHYFNQWGAPIKPPSYTVDPNRGGAETEKSRDLTDDHPTLDNTAVLRRYAQLRNRLPDFGPLANDRFFTHHLSDYCPILPEYFFNQHHLEIFAAQYPQTLQWLLARKEGDAPAELGTMDQILRESIMNIHFKSSKQLHYDPQKDRLDGNFLKIVMAAHRFLKTAIAGKQIAYALLHQAHEIITFDLSAAEKEEQLAQLAKNFCATDNTPKALKDRLIKRFGVDELRTLKGYINNDLEAAANNNKLIRVYSAYHRRHTAADHLYFNRFDAKIRRLQKWVDRSETRAELRENMEIAKAEELQRKERFKPDWFETIYQPSSIVKVLIRITHKLTNVVMSWQGYEKR